MKVPRHVVEARREKLGKLVASEHYLPLQEVCKRLGISAATARRDLAALHREGRIQRTHGGALSEFNERFPSYHERQRRAQHSKTALARAALSIIRPNGTYFFDSGTTLSYLASALADNPCGPIRILTVNLPVAELLAPFKEIEVYLTGGRMFARQSVLLGEAVGRSIESWRFDAAFLSAEGMDAEGLWNSQLAIIAHQHAVVRRAHRNVFLLDRSKFGRTAAHFLLPWPAVDCLLSDAPPSGVARFSEAAVRAHWHPSQAAPFPPESDETSSGLPVHYL
jgi:DeoR/GlpR family transcriptional regulator of sugar metabolism